MTPEIWVSDKDGDHLIVTNDYDTILDTVKAVEEPVYVKNDCRHLALGNDTTEGARCFKCNASLRWVVKIGGDDG